MSQLFCRLSKKLSSAPNRSLCFRRSEFSTATTPYLLLGSYVVGDSPCGGKFINYNLYDPRKQEQVKIENQILPKELHESRLIGSSRGWLASMNKNDSTVRLTKNKRTISLPPLIRDKFEHLVNVSVSSPNGEEEDSVIAVKFYGSRVSLCRLGGDSEWTRIDVPCPSFHSSTVMFSESDRRFYLNNCNPDYTGPTDFTPKSKSGLLTPVSLYKRFIFSSFLDEMPELESEMRLSRFKIQQQLIESSSGQSFIVLWFVERVTDKGEAVPWGDTSYNNKQLCKKTHKIMVFRQDKEQGIGPYTDDIGDLCIFLGDNESFCLSAKDFPGLNPNSVYFGGHGSGFGICDLASRTIRDLSDSTPPSGRMFWIPPTCQ
uniref:KIB1-4 beta-propeller domain-containing protein n=2 Tax=Noccaea caerulescens TaxID=107243 RepID=A0A1J3E0T3_NOCCA